MIKVKVEMEIPESRIADLLCSAMEGGTGYWARIIGYRKPKPGDMFVWSKSDETIYPHIHYPMSKGGSMILCEYTNDEDSERWTVTRAKLIRGLRAMAASPDYRHHFHNFMQENDDAETGDVFLQFAVLGRVVYPQLLSYNRFKEARGANDQGGP